MPVPVQCEQCQAKYLIEDRFAGKRAKCKRCGHLMTIPLPPPTGGMNDAAEDTDGSGIGMATPGAGSGTSSEAVTSQPGREWRPQDVVVERDDDVMEIAMAGPTTPAPIRGTSGALPWLPSLLLLLLVLALLGGAALTQSRLNALPPDKLAAYGAHPEIKVWAGSLLFLVGFFIVVGPLALGGITAASKIMRFPLPRGSYFRACGLAAVPVLLVTVASMLFPDESGSPVGAGTILGAAVLTFFATHYVFGTDWASTGASFIGVALLAGIGFVITANVTRAAGDAMFPAKAVEVATKKSAYGNSSAPPPDGSTQGVPPGPTSAPSTSELPRPRVTAPTEVPTSVPTNERPRTPIKPLITLPPDEDDGGLGGTAPATAPATPRHVVVTGARDPAAANAGVEEIVEHLRASAGPAVISATPLRLGAATIAIVRPIGPSQAFAVVEGGEAAGAHRVKIYFGVPAKPAGTIAVSYDPAEPTPAYALSPDGKRLARIAAVPKPSLHVYSAIDGHEVATMDLDATLGAGSLVGFLGPERCLIHWRRANQSGLEVWDLKTKRQNRRVNLPEQNPSPGNYAVSPDARQFATVNRFGGTAQLVLTSLFDNAAAKRMPIESIDERSSATPAGISYSPDGSKVAALFFAADGQARVIVWNAKGGKLISDKPVDGTIEPLTKLGAPEAAAGAGAGAGAAANANANAPKPASLTWLNSGGTLLVGGTAIVEANTGEVLADLSSAAGNVFDESAINDHTVELAFAREGQAAAVVIVTLDPVKMRAAAGSNSAAKHK